MLDEPLPGPATVAFMGHALGGAGRFVRAQHLPAWVARQREQPGDLVRIDRGMGEAVAHDQQTDLAACARIGWADPQHRCRRAKLRARRVADRHAELVGADVRCLGKESPAISLGLPNRTGGREPILLRRLGEHQVIVIDAGRDIGNGVELRRQCRLQLAAMVVRSGCVGANGKEQEEQGQLAEPKRGGTDRSGRGCFHRLHSFPWFCSRSTQRSPSPARAGLKQRLHERHADARRSPDFHRATRSGSRINGRLSEM